MTAVMDCSYCGPDCSSLTHPMTDRIEAAAPWAVVRTCFDADGFFQWDRYRVWSYSDVTADDMRFRPRPPEPYRLFTVGIMSRMGPLWDERLVWAVAPDEAVLKVHEVLATDDMRHIGILVADPVLWLNRVPTRLTLVA
jgi:hypothetical protein